MAGCKREEGDVLLLDGDGYVGISIHTTRGWKKSRAGGIADSRWEEDEELSWDGWLAQLRGKHISTCRDVDSMQATCCRPVHQIEEQQTRDRR